ncbi:MAG: hypothetical protein QXO82_06790 [Candidatus Methanomethylicia archaeon]
MHKLIAVCSLLYLFILLNSLSGVIATNYTKIYIYTNLNAHDQDLLNFLNSSNYPIEVYNISDNSYWENFSGIVDFLLACGIKVWSPKQEMCVGCHVGSWNSFLIDYAEPLLGYFKGGRLIAITVGINDANVVKKVLC